MRFFHGIFPNSKNRFCHAADFSFFFAVLLFAARLLKTRGATFWTSRKIQNDDGSRSWAYLSFWQLCSSFSHLYHPGILAQPEFQFRPGFVCHPIKLFVWQIFYLFGWFGFRISIFLLGNRDFSIKFRCFMQLCCSLPRFLFINRFFSRLFYPLNIRYTVFFLRICRRRSFPLSVIPFGDSLFELFREWRSLLSVWVCPPAAGACSGRSFGLKRNNQPPNPTRTTARKNRDEKNQLSLER